MIGAICTERSPEIVGVDEVGEMLFQLRMIVVVEGHGGDQIAQELGGIHLSALA